MTISLTTAAVLALCASLIGSYGAVAQEIGNSDAGRGIAETWCAQCHRISGRERDVSRVPPDFGAVADMPSQTRLSLRVFLQTPHGNMPRFQFTPAETDNIIAYLLSLRAS